MPGLIVEKAPPEAIEELPPEILPVGDNISWIPGYWGWDDERSDYLWISGTWRALPPGRQWTTSNWGKTGQAYQWTSGYWADTALQETVYLPKPPLTVEDGSLPDADKSRPGREITPKPVPREEPQVKEPKREPRQETQGMEHSDLHVRWQGRPQRIGCHGRGDTPHWGRGHRCQPGRKRG